MAFVQVITAWNAIPGKVVVQLKHSKEHWNEIMQKGMGDWHKRAEMFGVVVVGIGVAGRVRIRDLLNPLPNSAAEKLKLMGFVSRRTLGNIEQVKQITLEEALQSSEIQAAIISLENRFHEEYVRLFLEAGKHVCVEYPLALSVAAAQKLWDLADIKGKILHVEHIELLAEPYKQLKQQVNRKELIEGSLHFTGGPLDRQRTGFPAFSGIARLSWLVDLFGELTLKSATLEEQQKQHYWKMTTRFLTKNSRPLIWTEERGPELKRKKQINFQFKSDTLDHLPEAPNTRVGLFMQDLNLFAQKLAGQTPTELSEKNRLLHCLDLADEIRIFCEQVPPS
ncbi:biliverdin reductase A isoform X6 [Rhincodon typus]|uniref:biliverdin reductase A isoform X6 n=1 Tax=Rhincodon typus TaxID=259920 RepID=UPI002030FCC5|nr:biliverdin reductase A isoform X6 [Rhincodon typus]